MNTIGLRTLFAKEVRRFGKVWMQTVFSPLITTSLYFLVFGVALGGRIDEVGGVRYVEFVVPGLMMLAMINNAFLNASSSLFQSRINGTIVDLLISPLGPKELLLAYISASVLRGLIVGALVWFVALLFIGPQLHNVALVLAFAVLVCVFFAAAGLVVATYASRFDHLAVVPSFVLTPLTFLGGVFYTVDMLPEPWRSISYANPVLYMVNGLRYALTGQSDVPVALGLALVTALALGSCAWATWAFGRGDRLRRT